MTTDVDWQELIDRSFGDGPRHRPVEQRLVAGRRALRRRRIVVGAAAVALTMAAGGVALAAQPSEPRSESPVVDRPNGGGLQVNDEQAVRDLVAWTGSEWQVAREWDVDQRIPNPMGYEPPKRSVALEIHNGSVHRYVLATVDKNSGALYSTRVPEGTILGDWLVAAKHNLSGKWQPDPVYFGSGETLIAADGVTILDQLPHPNLPANFASDGERTAAAQIDDHGQQTFVLVREFDGQVQVIPFTGHFDSLQAFVRFAQQQYDSEEGLL